MNNIWLVRHGECTSNTGEMTSHPGTSTLTREGVLQSECIASYIDHCPDTIVYSPFIRSQQSAQATMNKCPDADVEEWPVQEFIYLPYEKYHDSTQADRKGAVDGYWQRCDPVMKASTEAESFIEFIDRMKMLVDELEQRKGHVIVFTHGHVIRAMIWKIISGALNDDRAAMLQYRSLRQALFIPNAAILKIDLHGPELQMSQLITAHLKLQR